MIHDVVVDCPYCGESFGTLVDGSLASDGEAQSDYYEDCAVCCRPIRFLIAFDSTGDLASLQTLTDAD